MVIKKIVLAILIIFFTTGCVVNLANIRDDYVLGKVPGKSVVFGEVEFKYAQSQLHQMLHLALLEAENKRVFNVNVNTSTFWERLFNNKNRASVYFFIELPPGKYLLTEVMMGNWQLFYPRVNFDVPESSKLLYIGTLELTQIKKANWFTGQIPVEIKIIDKYNEAKEVLMKKYPGMGIEATPLLMKREYLSYDAQLDLKEESNTWEKEYGLQIIKKIKENAYIYFDNLKEGQVFLEVNILNSGKVGAVTLIKERSAPDTDLQRMAVKAIKKTGSFGKFPPQVSEDEASFPIILNFKVKSAKDD